MLVCQFIKNYEVYPLQEQMAEHTMKAYMLWLMCNPWYNHFQDTTPVMHKRWAIETGSRGVWGAVVDKSKKHSINACKNFEID